jgi:hypothetical protein
VFKRTLSMARFGPGYISAPTRECIFCNVGRQSRLHILLLWRQGHCTISLVPRSLQLRPTHHTAMRKKKTSAPSKHLHSLVYPVRSQSLDRGLESEDGGPRPGQISGA